MWILNVVVIITFLFYIITLISKAVEQKTVSLYIVLFLAIAFEAIFLYALFGEVVLSVKIQSLILVFSYILPMLVVTLKNSKISFRLNILYAVAKISYSLKKYEFASGILKGAIKNDKKKPKYYHLRAKALEKMGDISSARDMFFKVIELDRENKEAYLELAKILDRENKKDTALVMLSQVLKLDPTYIEAKEMMGIIYFEIGRYKEALSIYEEIIASENGTYNTYYNLAILYWQNREIDKAIKTYNIAIDMNEELYEAYYALGRLYLLQGNFEKSIECLQKAMKDETLKAMSEFSIAENYIRQNNIPKSLEYLKLAVEKDNKYILKAKDNRAFDIIYSEIIKLEANNMKFMDTTLLQNLG